MKRHPVLVRGIPSYILAEWRGRPLYILLVYLTGQIIDPPIFISAIYFISFITGVSVREYIIPVTLTVIGLIALAYIFYHRTSTTIRRFLRAQIAGEFPDPDLATAAWREAVTFPQRIVGRVSLLSLPLYIMLVLGFSPRFGLPPALAGGTVAIVATIALSQVLFLFYLERAMAPLARHALASGAHPTLDDLRGSRLRLGAKLLLPSILIILLPVSIVGLVGYRQVTLLGGDPSASLRLTGLVTSLAVGVAILMAVLLVRTVSSPVREMQRVMERVGQGDLKVTVPPLTTDELAELGLYFNRMVEQLRQQEELKAAFGRYVSPAVRDGILSGQISLGGERREVTILFSDIRNFTAWCEREAPENVIQTLNSYYEILIQALFKYGGTVTRYTGDGVLALFGAPLDDPDHALHAVQAVLEAHALVEKFNDIRRGVDAFELHTGFGIHTGLVVVGSIGSEARAEYTPIGDAANVASRIEGLNRELGTAILISDATYQRVADYVEVGRRAEVRVKGRSRPVKVIEVVGMRNPDQEQG